ncbi:MAG: beta-ketoacyl synthase N-terminal-like domain-containing protein, partial [Desulfobacteraceae bacterium]
MEKNNSVAIIGMGGIFPRANGLKQYWKLLFNGEDAITAVPEKSHWSLKDYFDRDPLAPDLTYCKRGGFIPEIAFDPAKYGMPPNNLDATDTSQLLGLLVAEMALEDAGFSQEKTFNREKTNIILGVTGTQELVIPLGARLGHPVWKKALEESGISPEKTREVIQRISGAYTQWQENSFPGLLGNVVAGRIANRLDLKGTNSVVDAACASSLSAIHLAVMELVSGKCDLSVTGGVDTLNDIFMHMCFSKTGVLSHTSDAKPFSRDADGTVLGEGIGMVVLKRLEDATRDKDRIYAVIKGIGTSSDGKSGGIYAPSAEGQKRALRAAYDDAGVNPATVELIEAHGTGTRVGDKIEFTALKGFMGETKKESYCAMGSVKSMIGHGKAAAGAAGIIKSALGLYHKVLLPTLKADQPDPELAIENSFFYLNQESKPWMPRQDHPRRSGISAFGFGGSNFHAVLEEHEKKKNHVSWDGTLQIAAFSSDTREGLKEKLLAFKTAVTPPANADARERAQLTAWHSTMSRAGQVIALERAHDETWQLVEPVVDRADPDAVRSLLNRLENGKVTAFVAETVVQSGEAGAKALEAYGLDPARTLEVSLLIGDARAEKRVRIGSMTSAGEYYARDMSAPQVFRVDSLLVRDLDKSLEELRDHEVLRFNRSAVTQVELSRPGAQAIVVEQDTAGVWSVTAPTQLAARSWEVDGLLTDLE